MKLTTAKALWCGAALSLAGGTFAVVTLGERRIAEQTTTNERLVAQVAANSLAVRSRGPLLAERARLRADLRRLGTDGESTPLVARFVRDAARVANEHHASIASIAAPAAPSAPRARVEPLDAIPLAVTVEGRYADVLAVIRALSGLRVPAEIDVVSVVRTTQPGATTVAAALHVVLQNVEPATISDVGNRPD